MVQGHTNVGIFFDILPSCLLSIVRCRECTFPFLELSAKSGWTHYHRQLNKPKFTSFVKEAFREDAKQGDFPTLKNLPAWLSEVRDVSSVKGGKFDAV